MGVGGDHGPSFICDLTDRDRVADKFCLVNVLRRRSAAASEDRRPVPCHLLHRLGKLVRIDIVDSLSALTSRESRVRIYKDWCGGNTYHIF